MYQAEQNCNCHDKPHGLGFMEYLSAAGALLNSKGGGGGGAASPPSIQNTVATRTNLNTQVSPQISPNCIQQSNPTDSAVNASASMVPQSMTPSVMPPQYAPAVPYSSPMQIPPVVIAASLGLLGLFFFTQMRRGRTSTPRRRSGPQAAKGRKSRR